MNDFFKKHYLYFILLASLGSFISYFISQGFYLNASGDLMTFSWIINSDWMMHLAQVQAFAHLPFLDVILNNPLYSGEVLAYPFFVNWFSGILLSFTGNLVFSMTFPLYIGTFLFLSGIYFLSYQLTKNQYIAFLTPFIFFCLAGFQGYFTLQEYSWETWKNLMDYSYDLDFLVPLGFNWKSFFLTTYLPQRSFLWGMAWATLMLGLFVQFFQKDFERKFSLFLFVRYFSVGLGIGLLSVIHTHTFFWFFFLFLGISLIFYKKFFLFLSLAFGALLTSFPFIYILLQKQGEVSDFSLWPLSQQGYSSLFITLENFSTSFQNIIHVFVYWFYNWGIIFVLFFFVLIPSVYKKIFFTEAVFQTPPNSALAPEKYSRLLYPLFLISFVLLILFSVVQLQGNPWDNTKVHLWSGLFFALAAVSFFVWLWKQNLYIKLFSVVLFFLTIGSGIIMIHSGLNDNHFVIFSQQDQEKAQKISETISADSLILTSDYFHHYFAPLTPNSIFMGYRGWIASYGMDFSSKVFIAQQIYKGSPKALEYIEQEKIDYILVDSSAEHEYKTPINHQFFYRYFNEVLEFSDGSILYEKIK